MRPIFISDIQAAVARDFGVPREVMTEPDRIGSRCSEHVRPRQVAMALSNKLTRHSLIRIGNFFGGRDHTTVLSACRRVEQDAALSETVERLTLELVQ